MEIYNSATLADAEADAAARRKIMEAIDAIINDCRSLEAGWPEIKSARLGLEEVRADLWYDLRELEQAINAHHGRPWHPLKGET
jgi:hypothetical protein